MHISHRPIGPGEPVLICAEAGSNHNKDLAIALRLIDVAAESGCDAVKFQTFSADKHYVRDTPKFTYLDRVTDKSTYDLIKDAELPREWHRTLFERCRAWGIIFLSTPSDREAIDELVDLGMPAIKIASYEITDHNLVGYAASKGLPMIISTAMCDWTEIDSALRVCREAGNDQLILLQCTALYPAPAGLANLRAIPMMAAGFGVPVGLSDHTEGIHIPVAAVAMGACVIEKHITLDRTLPGPDHSFAIEPDELKTMVANIRAVESAMGNGVKDGPMAEEAEMHRLARRSVVSACDIPAGTVITADMLTCKRPGYGIPARHLKGVVGRKASVTIPGDSVMMWVMLG